MSDINCIVRNQHSSNIYMFSSHRASEKVTCCLSSLSRASSLSKRISCILSPADRLKNMSLTS